MSTECDHRRERGRGRAMVRGKRRREVKKSEIVWGRSTPDAGTTLL
jgi:hypothetical protein